MSNILLLILTLIISGTEPFWNSFSLAVIWAAVLGVKKHNASGAFQVFFLGLVRDVLLVNKLGQSSAVLLIVWAAAAAITSKLSRNLFAVTVPALAGYLAVSLLETGKINFWGMVITAIFSAIVIAIWTWKNSRETGIRVRLSS
ncbi:hypothetical protein HZB78_00465 [Candidatus Collierbacteria bacterium]|nr:hypothetical protein [Candidatus Collierbacteria bacterium]